VEASLQRRADLIPNWSRRERLCRARTRDARGGRQRPRQGDLGQVFGDDLADRRRSKSAAGQANCPRPYRGSWSSRALSRPQPARTSAICRTAGRDRNRINVARQRYNQAAEEFNSMIAPSQQRHQQPAASSKAQRVHQGRRGRKAAAGEVLGDWSRSDEAYPCAWDGLRAGVAPVPAVPLVAGRALEVPALKGRVNDYAACFRPGPKAACGAAQGAGGQGFTKVVC